MRKTILLSATALCLLGALDRPGFAVERKHHPWFSHHSTSRPTRRSAERQTPEESPTIVSNVPVVKGDPGPNVVKQAIGYEGTRYKYGGTSKHGIDCSGLVTRVWEDLKMKKIPRASSALYQAGKPIHLSELRPGDLVFFKNTSKSGISHVGVYAGNNKFVHAAGKRKGVTIAKLSDPYFQLHYAGARRLY